MRVINYKIGDLYNPQTLLVDRRTGLTSGSGGIPSYESRMGVNDGVECTNELQIVNIHSYNRTSGQVEYGMEVRLELLTPEGYTAIITVSGMWFMEELKRVLYSGIYTSPERYAIIHYRGVRGLISTSSAEYAQIKEDYVEQDHHKKRLKKSNLEVRNSLPSLEVGVIYTKKDTYEHVNGGVDYYEWDYIYLGKEHYINSKYAKKNYYTVGSKKHLWHLLRLRKWEDIPTEQYAQDGVTGLPPHHTVDFRDITKSHSPRGTTLGVNAPYVNIWIRGVNPRSEYSMLALTDVEQHKLLSSKYGLFESTGTAETAYKDLATVQQLLDAFKTYPVQEAYATHTQNNNIKIDTEYVTSLYRLYLSLYYATYGEVPLYEIIRYSPIVRVDTVRSVELPWYHQQKSKAPAGQLLEYTYSVGKPRDNTYILNIDLDKVDYGYAVRELLQEKQEEFKTIN